MKAEAMARLVEHGKRLLAEQLLEMICDGRTLAEIRRYLADLIRERKEMGIW